MAGRTIKLKVSSPYQRTKLFQAANDSDPSKGANVFYWGVWKPITFEQTDQDLVHVVRQTDIGRLDLVAYEFYGDVNLWWVIAHANNITNQFADGRGNGGMTIGMPLRIPNKSDVLSKLLQRDLDTGESRPALPVNQPAGLIDTSFGNT